MLKRVQINNANGATFKTDRHRRFIEHNFSEKINTLQFACIRVILESIHKNEGYVGERTRYETTLKITNDWAIDFRKILLLPIPKIITRQMMNFRLRCSDIFLQHDLEKFGMPPDVYTTLDIVLQETGRGRMLTIFDSDIELTRQSRDCLKIISTRCKQCNNRFFKNHFAQPMAYETRGRLILFGCHYCYWKVIEKLKISKTDCDKLIKTLESKTKNLKKLFDKKLLIKEI